MDLFDRAAFNKSYDSRTGRMIDRSQRLSSRGIGWSVTDVGRILIWLRIIAVNQPQFASQAAAVVKRLDMSRLIKDGYLQGEDLDPRKLHDQVDADGNTNPANAVTASLNTTGNGIGLSDASVGSGTLTITGLNASQAADQLGIRKTASGSAPGVINGDDTNPLQPQGIFSTLTLLRDALLSNDTAGITQAATLLQKDGQRAIKAQGSIGAREQDVAGRKTAATDQNTQLQQALSLLGDTDFAQAATRLQQLQTAFQASLQVSQTAGNLSLLDFLK
jgi:flagellin-like hook-associated protein FlgL